MATEVTLMDKVVLSVVISIVILVGVAPDVLIGWLTN